MKTRKKVVLPTSANKELDLSQFSYEMEALSSVGAELVGASSSSPEAFLKEAWDADAIMVSWGVLFDKNIISNLKKCVVIGVKGVGVDMVDVDSATEAGIVVTNIPDVFIEEVADHAMFLLLSAIRRGKIMDNMVCQEAWGKGRPYLYQFNRIWGQTLGLFAFGNIGTAVARRAKGFGLNVIAHDPYVSELKMTAEGVEPVSFEELLKRSDYLSLHSALNDETRGIIGEAEFAAMKNSVVLVNTSRGGVIDEAALIRALQKGKIAAAGLDVFEKEPADPDNPLLAMDNVILTPHVASASSRFEPMTRRRAGQEIALVLSGRWPMSSVNPSVLPRVELERWQPYPMGRGPNR